MPALDSPIGRFAKRLRRQSWSLGEDMLPMKIPNLEQVVPVIIFVKTTFQRNCYENIATPYHLFSINQYDGWMLISYFYATSSN